MDILDIILAVLLVLTFVVGIRDVYKIVRYLVFGIRTKGIITKCRITNPNRRPRVYITVKYADLSGEEFEEECDINYYTKYEEGREVPIMYLQENPHKVVIYRFWEMIITPLLIIGVLSLFLVEIIQRI